MSKPSKRSQAARNQHTQMGDIWFGDDESMLHARTALQMLAKVDPLQFKLDDQDDGDPDFPDYNWMLTRHADVGVLTMSGSMVSKESVWNRYFGMVSYEEVRNAAIVAADAGCRAILLDIDTNGGSAEGIGELSDFLTQFDQQVIPVYTYTGTKMLSAGYWIGAVGRKIFSSTMAMNGSIGVVSAHFSYFRQMEALGIDVTMFRQGEFKALGSPYEKLDDKAKADIEARMSKFYEMFLAHVSTSRGIAIPTLIDTAAEGRVFMGADAFKVGLVDTITTFDRAISTVMSEVTGSQQTVLSITPSTDIGMTDMKRQLTDAGLAAVASGLAESQALADPKLSEEVKEKTPEELEAETKAAEALAAQTQVVEPAPDTAPALTGHAETLTDHTLDKIIALSGDLAEARAEVKRLQASETERAVHMGTLMKICGDAINRMELPLSRSATSFVGMTAETMISHYHRTLSDFNSRMKIGAQAEVPGSADLSGATVKHDPLPDPGCVKL